MSIAKRGSLLIVCPLKLSLKTLFLLAEWENVFSDPNWLYLAASGKTIVGALLGGYAGVEIAKRLIGHREATGWNLTDCLSLKFRLSLKFPRSESALPAKVSGGGLAQAGMRGATEEWGQKNGFLSSRLFSSFFCPHSPVDPGRPRSLKCAAAGWRGLA